MGEQALPPNSPTNTHTSTPHTFSDRRNQSPSATCPSSLHTANSQPGTSTSRASPPTDDDDHTGQTRQQKGLARAAPSHPIPPTASTPRNVSSIRAVEPTHAAGHPVPSSAATSSSGEGPTRRNEAQRQRQRNLNDLRRRPSRARNPSAHDALLRQLPLHRRAPHQLGRHPQRGPLPRPHADHRTSQPPPVNLSPASYDPAFGSGADASIKAKIIHLIASVRTIMRNDMAGVGRGAWLNDMGTRLLLKKECSSRHRS
ncbi:hypothetical protein PCL_02799 [Purpureocillium lilacinum]|uniref:Uncharacterized protein n=1 Tax=Purpureocillium lilacinum TaxID=33203 RepID=A0A2U3DYV9_PURLI|nr:hypothetical protein PCL_02799 [Purpureocillium lilacinum]